VRTHHRLIRTSLAILAPLVAATLAATSAAYPFGTSADYSDCDQRQLPGNRQVLLRERIAQAVYPRRPAGEAERKLATATVLVAPAALGGVHEHLIAYVSGPGICGSGGCNAYVLAVGQDQPRYTVVSRISPARLPISVLDRTHHGQHDIGVFAAGGGIIEGYTGALPFDGKTYAGNPTLATIARAGVADGRVILAAPGGAPDQCRLR